MWKTFKQEMPEIDRPILVIEIGAVTDVDENKVEWRGAYVFHAFLQESGFGHALHRTDWLTTTNEKVSEYDHGHLLAEGKWAYLADVIRSAGSFESEAIFTNGDRPFEGRIVGPEMGFVP